MNDCLPQWTNLSILEEQQHTTASGCFDEFYFLTLKRDMMIVQGGTLVIFSFIAVLVPYLPYLKVQCNNFFLQLISCFGKGDTIRYLGIVIVRGAMQEHIARISRYLT